MYEDAVICAARDTCKLALWSTLGSGVLLIGTSLTFPWSAGAAIWLGWFIGSAGSACFCGYLWKRNV